jgi:hypothetical protein
VSVWVLPVVGLSRATVWRTCEGDSLVAVPITPESTCAEERKRRAEEVGDVCTGDERAAIFAAYGAQCRETLLEGTAATCPVCSVPKSLRPPHIPWPSCPEHDGAVGVWH